MYHYSALVLEHFLHPRNVGDLPSNLSGLQVVEVGNEAMGKYLRFYVVLSHQKIHQVRYQVYGCPNTIATASQLSELLLHSSWDEVKNIKALAIFERFQLSEDRMNCAILAEKLIAKLED